MGCTLGPVLGPLQNACLRRQCRDCRQAGAGSVKAAPIQSQTSVCESAAFVLAASDEVCGGIDPWHKPALGHVAELFLTVGRPIRRGWKDHMMLIDLNINGLFALVIRR
ncbi:hypothetical protein [Mycobacterium sp. HNNTM2301]|uniref:hypothetical protein n=1 Tax=Mycobacterium hainanense TaxID=3289775 RepID=UPI0035A5A89F